MAASKIEGAPDFRTLSHWETSSKMPSLVLLIRYLGALGLDLRDLQDALDLELDIENRSRVDRGEIDKLAEAMAVLDRRLCTLEDQVGGSRRDLEPGGRGPMTTEASSA